MVTFITLFFSQDLTTPEKLSFRIDSSDVTVIRFQIINNLGPRILYGLRRNKFRGGNEIRFNGFHKKKQT